MFHLALLPSVHTIRSRPATCGLRATARAQDEFRESEGSVVAADFYHASELLPLSDEEIVERVHQTYLSTCVPEFRYTQSACSYTRVSIEWWHISMLVISRYKDIFLSLGGRIRCRGSLSPDIKTFFFAEGMVLLGCHTQSHIIRTTPPPFNRYIIVSLGWRRRCETL